MVINVVLGQDFFMHVSGIYQIWFPDKWQNLDILSTKLALFSPFMLNHTTLAYKISHWKLSKIILVLNFIILEYKSSGWKLHEISLVNKKYGVVTRVHNFSYWKKKFYILLRRVIDLIFLFSTESTSCNLNICVQLLEHRSALSLLN